MKWEGLRTQHGFNQHIVLRNLFLFFMDIFFFIFFSTVVCYRILNICINIPVVYSRTMLSIHPIYNSLPLLGRVSSRLEQGGTKLQGQRGDTVRKSQWSRISQIDRFLQLAGYGRTVGRTFHRDSTSISSQWSSQ